MLGPMIRTPQSFDWGDGITDSYEITGNQSEIREFVFDHQYYGSGVYDVYVRIYDDAGSFRRRIHDSFVSRHWF